MKIPGATAMLSVALPWIAGAQAPVDTVRRDSAASLPPVRIAAPRIAGASATAPYALDVRTAEVLPLGTPAMALDEAVRMGAEVQVVTTFVEADYWTDLAGRPHYLVDDPYGPLPELI